MVFKKKNIYERYTDGLDKNEEDFENEAIDKSEHNMGSFHFIRYHKILTILDNLSIEVNSYNNSEEYKSYIHYYYSTLKTLYNNIKGLLTPQIRNKYDQDFQQLKTLRRNFITSRNPPDRINHPEQLIEKLEETHANLIYSVDRHIGLGIPRIRIESTDKAAKRALGIT